jgi:ppGpp synthetase/RelA/SpoT-type nucleotidyltranferase
MRENYGYRDKTMDHESIYGEFAPVLPHVLERFCQELDILNGQTKVRTGEGIYEHLISRVKSEESMREKCDRRGLPQTCRSALAEITDAIGVRVITRFIDDIFEIVSYIRALPDVEIVKEKDYIRNAKPNGYRSYHLILSYTVPWKDIDGQVPGCYFIEVQLRTIAMDSWASLEHQLKYKKNIKNQKLIVSELKRCADELAGCDLSMQTIRNLIRSADEDGESARE